VKYDTTRFGQVEIADDMIISMGQGILGFAKLRKYFILDHAPGSPFKWLQSAEDSGVAFVICEPGNFKRDYQISIKWSELTTILNQGDNNELLVALMVAIPEDPTKMTANLRAPLIINLVNLKAMQYVILDQELPLKFPVLEGIQNLENQPQVEEILKIKK